MIVLRIIVESYDAANRRNELPRLCSSWFLQFDRIIYGGSLEQMIAAEGVIVAERLDSWIGQTKLRMNHVIARDKIEVCCGV